MDYQFENEYQFNRNMVTEYQYRIGGLRMLLWGIISVVFAVLYTVPGVIVDQPQYLIVVAFLALAAYYFAYPWYYVRKNEKNMHMRFPDGLPVTRICFGERIDVTDGEASYYVDYVDILRVTSLKYGYYLHYRGRNTVALDPNGFVKGDFAALKEFLRQKRPDLKIPE